MIEKDLKKITYECVDLYIITKKVLNFNDDEFEWLKKYKKYPEIFNNTDFYFDSLQILNDQNTEIKYNFIRAYYEFYYHAKYKFNPRENISPIDLLIQRLSKIEYILGRELAVTNGRRVYLNSSFNINDYETLPVGNLVAFEFAPIIECWVDLCLQIKNELKDELDKILTKKNIIGESLLYDHKLYKEFEIKRSKIIDNFVAQGRLETKSIDW